MNSLYIALNMLRRMIGSKKGFVTIILIPVIVMTVIIGIFDRSYDETYQVAYLNLDEGMLGEELIRELSLMDEYEFTPSQNNEEVRESVISGKVDLAIVVQQGFTDKLLNEENTKVTLYQINNNVESFVIKQKLDIRMNQLLQSISHLKMIDGSNSDISTTLETLMLQMNKHQIKPVTTQFNDNSKPGLNSIIGFMIMFLMGLIVSSVSLILEDRTNQTMMRMYSAPVSRYEIVFGNFLGSFLVGALQITLLLVFTKYIIGFDYGVSFGKLFIILLFFMLASMGIASALASTVNNINILSNITPLIVVPTCMIGGCFWPIEIMPDFMQKLANIVPQKWAIEAIENMAMGQGLADVGLNLAVLLLFAVILIGFGSAVFKPVDS
ncbi:ABC transporter permease [Chengkuizengella axinellae]|uniref:ABC transporter permease n=1 Tax=Chengkuizengella axinellae TaxID=3064388 RepID=A0ABT9IVC8_9BACL|nr:ABC transporter permease [Chengkuizengella sp. 2205SS18-9]MDP5273305.1 ABC transporter permease [Chengkuizengella sp. 2205SS18-9]